MSAKKTARVPVVAMILPFVVGLAVGYAGRGLFAPASENAGPSVSESAGRVSPSPQAESGEDNRRVPLETEATQAKEARIGKAPRVPPAARYERVPDMETLIRDLHESMPDPGSLAGPEERDPYLADPDDVDLVATNDTEREEAYHAQSELIAALESQYNPPAWEPDEDESEDPYLDEDLPEIAEWEELETIQDDPRAEAAGEPEHPIPLEEEPLPPSTE